MTDVSLVHTSGGLLGDVYIDTLRELDASSKDAQILAAIGTFTRPDGTSPKRAEVEADLEAAFRSGQALWAAYHDELADGMDVTRLRERLLLPFLTSLGFNPVYQRSHPVAGGSTWAITHLGWPDDPLAPPMILQPNTDLDDRTGRKRSPHEELQGYLNNTPVRWGILSNGHVLRVLRDFHHTRTRGYVEIDLDAVFDAASLPDFLALWRLAHASRFRAIQPDQTTHANDAEVDDEDDDGNDAAVLTEDDGPDTLLERAYRANLNAGVAAGKRLQPQVRFALESFANGLLDATPGLRKTLADHPEQGREFYRELLTVVYRLLFLMLAEQRGMLTNATDLYDETYSITALRGRAESGQAESRRHDLWEGLTTTFRLFSDADAAANVGVYPYNGQLFDLARTPYTSTGRCPNKNVVEAVTALTTVSVGKMRMHVDYRNLGVEELGAVYESLLEYTLTIAEEPTPSEGRVVPGGAAYLAPLSTERKDLASYYTPSDLVDLLLARSLDLLIGERLRAAGDDPESQEHALLSLRVIDPACGSAAILIGALDRVAQALASVRCAPHEPRDADLASARRDVLQRCIYGVDKDPFAVELAKVALWIHCLVPDQPLSFLDSRIVCGDALVGWPLLDLPSRIPADVYDYSKAAGDDKQILKEAKRRNAAYIDGSSMLSLLAVDPELRLPVTLTVPDQTFEAVRAKSAAFAEWRAGNDYRHWKAVADIWTAAPFWTSSQGEAPTTVDYQSAVAGNVDPDLADRAERALADINPLHWPLAFPEVRAAGGFDLVVGNPPWAETASVEKIFFGQADPRIAALPSEERGKAIKELATKNPALFDRWVKYKETQARFTHYAKTCGRYTRTGGKTNTYVLFTELAADVADHAGVIVKSGIATDEAQSPVWKSLVAAGRAVELRDMVNSGPDGRLVFPAVAPPERFCAFMLGPARPDRDVVAAMLNFGVAEASLATGRQWSRADLARAAPVTHTLLSTASDAEIDLALDLQSRFSTLDFNESTGSNPWGITYTTLFNSTNFKKDGLAIRPEQLVADGYRLDADKVFRHPDGRSAVPVYEGQMANRWDHRARTYEGYEGDKKYGRKPVIPLVTEAQHADPLFEVEPRYWMDSEDAEERIQEVAGTRWILGWRAIGRAYTDPRTVRVALLGRRPATDSLPVVCVDSDKAFALLGLFNSMPFDFLMRVHMSGPNISPWIASQCAAPAPADLAEAVTESAKRLSVTSRSLGILAACQVATWDLVQRELDDARIDALVARAYGFDRATYELVLDHFQRLRRAEEGRFGEYRSKRLRLEAFDTIVSGGS